MINVAIIDDGISTKLYNISNIDKSIEITRDLKIRNVNEENLSKDSHGTICAAILQKYYSNTNITSIKILDKISGRSTKAQFVKAIEWCIDNGIKVINLSIGTVSYSDFNSIKKIIDIAYINKIIIIAACNNRNIFTCPASYSNVIGVKCLRSKDLEAGQYILNLNSIDGIEISAYSKHSLLTKLNEVKITKMCNSFATPMITAKVCEIIETNKNITLEQIKIKLNLNSIKHKLDNFYGEYRLKKEIDIPFIIIYDDVKNRMIKTVFQLISKFKSDGYYAGGCCTKSDGILYGLEYVPINKESNVRNIKEKIEIMYRVYDWDIIILGINIGIDEIDLINKINICVNPDKVIFVVDSFTLKEDRQIANIKIHKPLIITEKSDIKKLKCNFNIFKGKDLNKIYKYILNIFI
ncbi:hypothetical protein FDB42_01805 [Clostridium botulinum]|uniref:S8 family serine peptidase n=1 Tax=Clostridium botulinum TaxID=1491 RepID=UPI0014005E59|nr:S8 family serine peptidase [Clostridium botulinum]MBY6914837.1 S8 family serine peptidase [Clostridium botulinum]NFO38855.1 hypothetical protein [Clostridium botulinum]NFQ39702.1 hypothetical protein [Clostridium botulinum]